jgi:cyclopropane fatty-acyl-phospholipid synthase-like methyltransferase
LAARLKCHCLGIDAIEEFIAEAKHKATEYDVEEYCTFEVADIRQRLLTLPKYDVILLASIGPVLGNHDQTMSQVLPCLKQGGIVILDDAYIDDSSTFQHTLVLPRAELLRQLATAQMEIIDEVLMPEAIGSEYEEELASIVRRCGELSRQYPEKAQLFHGYVQTQRREYEALENKMTCSTLVIRDPKP